MRRPATGLAIFLTLSLGGCATAGPSQPASVGPTERPAAATTLAASGAPTVGPTPAPPAATPAPPSEDARVLLFDTDVAGDDLVALSFLVNSPQVRLVAVTVSGTGEAHCEGGVDVVLRLLERLGGPDIPVACGRETPLEGSHTFPAEWRERVDAGSGLELPSTDRRPSSSTALELIKAMAGEHADLVILATGPLTNLADALKTDPGLSEQLGSVYVMGGALHVPGNLVCCGAPEDNDVAEWNIYVDPHAAQVVVDSGVMPTFISLDGTNQVPLTVEFANRAMEAPETLAHKVLAELFTANPYMTDGSFYLWDALAAQVAAGYPVGTLSPAAITVEEAEGPESGFTRPTQGEPNIEYLSTADAAVAHDTLLAVLARR